MAQRVHRPHNFRALSHPKPISKNDHRHYWPYMPVALLVISVFLMSLAQPLRRQGVLAYATNLSTTALLNSTNQQRGGVQVNNLQLNKALSEAAQAKADDMIKRNYWSHNTPDNQAPWVFIQSVGYSYLKAGENLAYGFTSSDQVVHAWMNSPSHRENMLDQNYTEVGFGFANGSDYNHAGPETVVVAMYGKPAILGDTGAKPITASALPAEPAVAISKADLLMNNRLPWLTYALGLLSGLAAMALLAKHAFGLRRIIRSGERFVLHHPMLDTVLVGMIVISVYLSQITGFIK